MSFKRGISILLIFLMFFLTSGCTKLQSMKEMIEDPNEDEEMAEKKTETVEIELDEEDTRETVIYYKDKKNLLIPVSRDISWDTGIAKKTLSYMVNNDENQTDMLKSGLIPVLPSGSQILGMSVDEETGISKINFSKEVLNTKDKTEEVSLVNAVVYTLTEFPTIEKVEFMIEGQAKETLTYGTDISEPIERRDINLVDNDGDSKVVVYYKGTQNGEYEYYVPITKTVTKSTSDMYTAIEELFEGPPKDSGLYSDIPMGVELKGVEVKESTALIDLSASSKEAIANQGAFDSMNKNIALTLDQFEGIENVEILFEGEKTSTAIPTFANKY